MTNKIGEDLIKLAEKLKSEKIVESPEWAKFVKTGGKQRKSPGARGLVVSESSLNIKESLY